MILLMRLLVMAAVIATAPAAIGQAAPEGTDETPDWPREIHHPKGKVIIYQPQPESFKGNKIDARAAISVTLKGESEPRFGAIWIRARVHTDRNERTVDVLDVKIPKVRFPEATPEQEQRLTAFLESEITSWNLHISLDRLLASLELAEKEQRADDDLKSTPPKIIYSNTPAVLVTLDGEARMEPIEGKKLMRVVNTPVFIVLNPATRSYFMLAGDAWMTATDVMGPWKETTSPPSLVTKAAGNPELKPATGKRPRIVVTTTPAELISTDGNPEFSPVYRTDLLTITNTGSDLFLQMETQVYHVVISGRWFSTRSLLHGPWAHVPGAELPEDFKKIPAGSAKGNVRTFIPGTEEASDAVMDTYIPQTEAISRDKKTDNVKYDGEPQWRPAEGTKIVYAANTKDAVFQVEGKFYLCREGAWYVSRDKAEGPWAVCHEVPAEIYTIKPSCPVYYVKYVKVYDVTPTVVYVGYTPGYVGCYAYGGAVVYGTGYVYPAWTGTVYYPYPVTYGYSYAYRPYAGWGFAAGVTAGFIAGAWAGSHYGGWWGCGGWGHCGDIDISRNWNRNVYNRPGNRPGTGPGNRPGTIPKLGPGNRPGNRPVARPGNRPGNKLGASPGSKPGNRPGNRPGSRPGTRPGGPSYKRPNNHYADRNGNVHRRTNGSWQSRQNGSWSSGTGSRTGRNRYSSQPTRGRSGVSRESSGLNRSHYSRQRGSSRSSGFNRSRSGGGGSRGGFSGGRGRGGRGGRGGGGRR